MSQEAATILGAAAGTATVMVLFTLAVARKLTPWFHLRDDLLGEEPRPGRARQPGVMERIADNERVTLIAAEQAAAAKTSSWRTEELMRRHMENGLEIMEVGIHNDSQLYLALREHGIEVHNLREYPAVDVGGDRRIPGEPRSREADHE